MRGDLSHCGRQSGILIRDYGASGDIGFTQKASNINGLRAIKQQYLHQNQISALDFEGVPVMDRPFFAQKQGKESLTIDQVFSYIILFL